MDIGAENIIIYVYDINKVKPFDSFNHISEAIRSILADNIKKIKIGVIGNKLDLVSQSDIKEVKEIGEKYTEKINGIFLMTSIKKGMDDIIQFILNIINFKSKNVIILKNKKTIINEYQQLFKLNNLNRVIRCEKCKTKFRNNIS